nr:serine protease 57 isoform X1 [Globicephala melas]
MRPGEGSWACLLLTLTAFQMLPMRPPGSWASRIIGGHKVTPHSRPYMASVSFQGQHHCGGFLLQIRWVVSAAHCFRDRDPQTGLVVLGAHDLRTAEATQQVFSISAVFTHPDYHLATHTSDICLLRLNSSAILGPAVGLLGLPRRPPRAGARCQVAGWGSVSDFEELPPVLMEAEVRVLGLDICNSSWKGRLSPAMLCTRSGDRRRRGFCSKSGPWHRLLLRPLVRRPQDPRRVHTGVRLRDLDLGRGSAGPARPPAQPPTQDHWGPSRSCLNHSSAQDEVSSGLENSVAGAEGPWAPKPQEAWCVWDGRWDRGESVPNKKGKITQ